jgi:hypothetical protein
VLLGVGGNQRDNIAPAADLFAAYELGNIQIA